MTTRLVCGGEAFEVKMEVLVRLSLFQKRPMLLQEGYQVRTRVDADIFREFLSAAEGGDIALSSRNVFALADLCKEFGFPLLMARIKEYEAGHPEAVHFVEMKKLQKTVQEQGRTIEELRSAQRLCCREVRDQIEALRSEVAALRRDVDELSSVKGDLDAVRREQRSRSDEISSVKRDVAKAIAELKGQVAKKSSPRPESPAVKRKTSPATPVQVRTKGETYAFTEGAPFKGIISHLSDECGDNAHVKGVVIITASSNDHNQCHQVTDYGWNGYWCTKNEPNSWICFDFKDKTVSLTKYSLKSDGGGYYHLIQWVIEGSNDGGSWEELDSRSTQDLNGRYITKTYDCQSMRSESYRYLRLRQTGKNSGGDDQLRLSEIEFFGTLKTDEKAAAVRMKLLREEEEHRRQGSFSLCDQRPFWGIISHLSDECGGNVHEKGVVNITASSNDLNQCHQVTDYGWNNYWFTKDEPNSWICFDFKDKTVSLTKYSLKSDGSSRWHLLQWVIEGSNDVWSWEELDSRYTQDLNGTYITKTYDCQRTRSESYRYLRLRQTGENSWRSDRLCLSEIEFFGVLHRQPI